MERNPSKELSAEEMAAVEESSDEENYAEGEEQQLVDAVTRGDELISSTAVVVEGAQDDPSRDLDESQKAVIEHKKRLLLEQLC